MNNNFEPAEDNELMAVLNNSDKEKIAKAIDRLNTLDFSCISNETKEKIIELFKENTLPVERLFANYRCAIMEVETKFKVLNEEFSLIYDGNPIESIKSRIKSNESILKKIIRKNLPFDLDAIEEHLEDIAGIRVICSFIDDIYKLADCFLRQDDITLIKMKDYIKNPKPSGYRSLHLIVAVPIFLENEKKLVKVEVQFRTIAMDFWASLEHKLRYNKRISPKMLDELSRELNECATESAELDYRMQNVKNTFLGKGKQNDI
ncbi:MAG: GTP pyrophosphokinase [Catonella sp.]|uniref:GTP pyrophosphokinase n=1 Tax=Catonella sp. TaxID=2382125 RepID=UPI003FA026B5